MEIKHRVELYAKDGSLITETEGQVDQAYELLERNKEAVGAGVKQVAYFGEENNVKERIAFFVTRDDLERAKARGAIRFDYEGG